MAGLPLHSAKGRPLRSGVKGLCAVVGFMIMLFLCVVSLVVLRSTQSENTSLTAKLAEQGGQQQGVLSYRSLSLQDLGHQVAKAPLEDVF